MNRDDTFKITREDVLRELELLPVWRLRAQPETATLKPSEAIQKIQTKSEAKFDYFQSENSAWVFICPAGLIDTASQSMLFDNILIALQIKAKKTTVNLANCGAKVLVVMGEKTAQALLNSTETIDNLRGKQHVLHNLPLIVTYSTAEILEHLPNKAKTWDDLCLAFSIVNA